MADLGECIKRAARSLKNSCHAPEMNLATDMAAWKIKRY